MTTEPRTPRQQIRDRWQAVAESNPSFDPKEEGRKIKDELINDPAFCAAFLDAFLYPVIQTVGNNLFSQRRSDVVRRHVTAADVADIVVDRFSDLPDAPTSWSKWLEHEPKTRTYIRLLDMTKEQLIAAAMEREGRGETELRRASLNRLIAGRLKEGQVASDVWTEDEVTVLYDRIEIVKPKHKLRPLASFLSQPSAVGSFVKGSAD